MSGPSGGPAGGPASDAGAAPFPVAQRLLAAVERALDAADLPNRAVTVTSTWAAEHMAWIDAPERALRVHVACVQTKHTGAAFSRTPIGPVPDGVVGRSLREVELPGAWHLAALDALMGSVIGPPDDHHDVTGDVATKLHMRASIIADEARRLVGSRAATAARHGVDGEVDAALRARGLAAAPLTAADVMVIDAASIAAGDADVPLDLAHRSSVPVVVLCSAGANFAEVLLALAADTVLAEPSPFAFTGEWQSELKVYRGAGPAADPRR